MAVSQPAKPGPDLGVYLHWPFCQAICPYCDFNVIRARPMDQVAWAEHYVRELNHFHEFTPHHTLRSIFFGGGTPSLMQPEIVGLLIDHIKSLWQAPGAVEVSLEANPSDASAPILSGFANAGVNRLSLGVQALNDSDLKGLGRWHTSAQALKAIEHAKAIFPSVSFDLIYGRPGQTLDAWETELAQALALAPDHLSLYQLTIEPGTAFERAQARGRLIVPEEDDMAGFYETAGALCAKAGLDAYEVSNHARPGAACAHNLIYWRCGDYIGVGPGAHGRLSADGQRYATVAIKKPKEWAASVERHGHGRANMEALDKKDQLTELLLMGLRVQEGVDLARVQALSPGGLERNIMGDLQSAGLIATDALKIRTTQKGRAVLNAVLERLLN